MISDTLENYKTYINVINGLEDAIVFVKQCAKKFPATGKYELDGDKMFALVQEYITLPREQVRWEVHKRYIDIQFIISGKEIIEWSDISNMPEGTLYDSYRDIAYCEGVNGSELKLGASCFAMFFPQDMHRPMCVFDEPVKVKKVIIKVAV